MHPSHTRLRALAVALLLPCTAFCDNTITAASRHLAPHARADSTVTDSLADSSATNAKVVIANAPDSLAVGDTARGIVATPYDVIGRKSPSSRLSWTTRPNGSVTVLLGDAKGQHVAFVGLSAATTYAVATWTRSDGLVVRDSVRVVVYAKNQPAPIPQGDTTTSGFVAATPELPRAVPPSKDPYPGKACTVAVPLAGDMNAYVAAARGGSVVCFQAGATYPGTVYLPQRAAGDTGWVVLRSTGALPAEGTRIRPFANAGSFATIAVQTNATQALVANASASGYYVRGLELTTAPSVTLTYDLVSLGTGTADENTIALLPTRIVLAQVYVHGQPTQYLKRCVALNGGALAVVDSWLEGCHVKGQDAQAIGGWSGVGPYLISNDYLEGSGENVLIGGAPPAAEGLVASDVTITRNWIHTPSSWAPSVYTRKNLLELKSVHRALIEGNVMDGSWTDGQTGGAVLVKSSIDAPFHGMNSTDVTIRNNRIFNVGEGFAITGRENYDRPDWQLQYPAENTARVRVENNYVDSVNVGIYQGGGRLVFAGGLTDGVADVALVSNTLVTTGPVPEFIVLTSPTAPSVDRLDVQRNVFTEGNYGLAGSSSTTTIFGSSALSFATPSTFLGNVLVRGVTVQGSWTYPSGTTLVTSIGGVPAGSGADVSRIVAATSGVVVQP